MIFHLLSVSEASGQTTVNACANGIYSVTDPKVYSGFPPGLATDLKGMWRSNPSTLTFSQPTIFKTIISGFAQNTDYTVTWRSANNNKDYTFIIHVGTNTATTPQLEVQNPNPSWNSNDIVYCTPPPAKPSYDFRMTPTTSFTAFEYWITNTTGTATLFESNAGGSASLNNTEYNSHYTVWGVATSTNGCQAISDSILMSEMTSTQVVVVGGKSVCGATVPPNTVLEVLPYNTNGYTYQWRLNGVNIVGANSNTYTVTNFGLYNVIVTGCAGNTYYTNSINVTNTVLPDVTLTGGTICQEGGSTLLTSTLSSTATVDYKWFYGGVEDASMGDDPSATALGAGLYQTQIVSTSNPDCYKNSNTLNVEMTNISATLTKLNNTGNPFCASEAPANRTPRMELNISNGTAPFTAVINGVTYSNLALGANVIAPSAINTTTAYTVASVTDATGCTTAATLLPAAITYTVEPAPTVQTVTYSGGCTGSSFTASLLNAQAGVTYRLRLNGVTQQTVTPAAAGPFSFATFTPTIATAGTYDVTATGASGSCSPVTMAGTMVVGDQPNDQTFSPAGPICRGGTLTLVNSETGVRYYVLNNGVRTGAFQDGVSGSPISFGGLAAGTYTVEAVRGGCTRLLSGSITVLADATPFVLSTNQTSYCQNVAPTGVNLSLSDSEAGYNYTLQRNTGAGFVDYLPAVAGTGNALPNQWTNISNGNFPNGIYQVVATSTVGGCSTTMQNQVTINQLALPTATVTNSLPNSRCAGASTTFNVNVALTGSQPFNFDIVNNAGLPTINVSNFYGNVYTVSVSPTASTTFSVVNLRDANACSVVAGTGQAVFNVNPAPVVNFSSSPNPIATNALGVPSTQVCSGSNVTLTANANNTLGAKTYSWSDGLGTSSTVSFPPNVTRQYTVAVTNEFGCSTVSPVEVVVNPLPVVDFLFSPNSSEVCKNVASVELVPTGVNTTGGGFTVVPNTPGAVVGNFFYPLVAPVGRHLITYNFKSTDGCVNTATHYIDVNPLPPAIIRNLQTQYCADAGTVTINSTPQSNADGQWSVVGFATLPAWFTEQADGSARFNVTGAYAAAGPHQYEIVFTFTDPVTGCANEDRRITRILDDADNIINFRNLPPTSCQSAAPVTLEAFFNNATNALIGSGTFSGPGITNNQTAGVNNGTATFDPAVAGNGNHTITYNYTDANGCSGSVSHSIQIGTTLTIDVDPNYCKIDNPDIITCTPAGGTFSVTDPLGVTLSPSLPYTFIPSGLPAGVYRFDYEYVSNPGLPNECVNEISQNVTVADKFDASFSLPTKTRPDGTTYIPVQFCRSESSVLLTPQTPGGSFSGPGVSLNYFNPQIAGVGMHTVTYTIKTGNCSYSTSQVLRVTDLDQIDISNLDDAYCDNETGPFLIEAHNKDGAVDKQYTFSTTANATGQSPLYTIDVAGVKTYASTINANQCYFDPTVVGQGYYTVTLTCNNSASGCITVYSKTVRVFPAVGVNFGGIADPIKYCMDAGDVFLQGSFSSTGMYTGAGNFSGPAGVTDAVADDGEAIFNPAGLAAGLYPVTYTLTLPAANGGCTTSRTKSFEVLSTPFVYNVTPSTPLAGHYCDGGTGITIGVHFSQNNVTYNLIYNSDLTTPVQTRMGTGGAITFATPVTKEGIYTVQAVSADGCKVMMAGSVKVVINKVALTINTTDVKCKGGNDGKIVIIATGGSDTYTYYLDGVQSASNTFSGLTAKTYSVNVKDAIGCTFVTPFTVPIKESTLPLTLSNLVTTPVGCACALGACDGSASVVISGGTPFPNTVYPEGYKIEWIDASNAVVATSSTATGLSAGNYLLRVTDMANCVATQNVTITTEPALTLFEDITGHQNVTCYGASTGVIRVVASGGSGATQYQFSRDNVIWYSNGTGTYSFTGLPQGTYKIYVRNAKYPRCTAQLPVDAVISQPSQIVVSLVSRTNVSCYGAADGSLEVRATGGGGTYEYSKDGTVWQISPIFGSLIAGAYHIYVRDAASTTCSTSLATLITITQPSPLSFSYVKKDVTCNGLENGEITVSAYGGSGSYEYSRDNGLTWHAGNKFINLSPGNYQLRVRDMSAATCQTAAQPVTIVQPLSPMSAVVTKVDASCSTGASDGSATIVVNNVAPIQSISWSNGVSNVNSVSGLAPGAYSVLVTDVNGCTLNTPFTISTLPALTLSKVSHVNITCNGATTGSLTVLAGGGSTSYEYSIDGIAWQSSGTFSGLDNGSYTVMVRDAKHPSCTYTMVSKIIITEPAPLTINEVLVSRKNVSCYGSADGSLEVIATGGSGIYNYSIDGTTWTVAPNSPIFTGLYSGSYRIYVRDAAATSCLTSVATPITISQPVALSFNYAKKDVTCFGDLSGEITVTAFGGSGIYEYSKDNGINWQDNHVFTGLAWGSYNIVVRNKNATGCQTAAQVVTISQPTVAIDATLKSQVNVKCYGASTGQIVLDPVPAGASLQYSIDGGVTWSLTTTFNNLKAGTYIVMVKNATCQNNNALTVVITQPAASLSISNASSANITCASNSSSGTTGNGTANVTLSGGVTPYTYQWINTGNGNPVAAGNITNTASSSTISNMADGTYRIDITDANSCAVSRSFTITKPADWNVVHTSTNVTVVGASDGSIKITSIAGGTAPYKITWSDGAAFNDMTSRSNLAKGTYTFTITDASGCTYTRSVIISDNHALSVTFKGTDIKCFGYKTGSIDVNVSNGVPGYQLTWSGLTATGATPSGTVNNVPVVYTLANLEAGTYTLTIRDNNGAGATVSQIIVINQPTTPVSIAVSKTDVICNGNNNGTIDVRATGGTPFAANTYDISIIPGSTVHLNSNVFTNLVPGAYSVVAVDSYGCFASQNVTITEPLPLTVTFTQTNVDCNGAATGSLTAKVNGRSPATSFRYDWYTVSGATQTTYLLNGPATITNLTAGTYRVIVTAGSCSVTADAVISQNSAVTAVSTISNVTTCQGDNTGSISLTLSGGVAPYIITYNVGGNPVTVSTASNVYEITGLYAGNYNILVADSKGCSTTLSNQVVTEPATLTVTGVTTNINCVTPSTGTLNFSIAGGLTLSTKHRYAVTLNGPNGYSTTQILNPNAGAITPVAYNSLNAGNYTLVVQDALSTDADRCQVIESFTLSHITIEGTMVQPTCQGLNNGEITNVIISGAQPGYTATWSTVDGSGLDLTSLPQAGLTAGTYRLTVVEPAATGRGCTVTRDFVLTNQRVPTVDGAVADVTCYGGNNGSITAIVATEMTINQYNWSGPGITNSALSEQLNLVVGTYQLEVTDIDGCMATRTFDVHEPTAITYNLTSKLDNCNPHRSSITLNNISGGTGSVYQYYWQGPGIVATTANLTGLTNEGLYTLTVSDDNNCQVVKSIYITEGIKLDTAVVRPTCFGGTNGSILVTVTGGSGNFKYTWSRNGVVIPTETTAAISNIGAGTYRAVVTDLTESVGGVSCSQSIDIVINDKAPFVIDESVTPISCHGDTNGAINITVSGGTPSYQYLWSGTGVNASAEDQTGLTGGTYSVTITDQNGCKASESYVITEPAALAFNLTVTQTTCAGVSGELEVINAAGGTKLAATPFYNFQWAGPGVLPVNTTTTKVSNLIAGDYTVQMSDKNGCKLTKSATLYSAIEATYSVKPQTCSNMPDGQIDMTVSGGVAPYTYAWTTVDGGNLVAGAADQSGLASGTYNVTIKDSRPSCQISVNNIVVKQQSQLVVTGKVQPVLCYGKATGAIKLTVAGGIGTYSYVWSGPGITVQPSDPLNVTGLIKGNYQVVVTDNFSGCQEMKQFTVDGPDALLAIDNITTTNVLCYGSSTGEILVSAVGGAPYGTAPNEYYKYLWTGPLWLDSIANQFNLPAGNYTVRVKDSNGCLSDVTNVIVSQPVQPISISLDEIINVAVKGSSTGAIEITSAGGLGNHTYKWEKCTSTGTLISVLPATGTRVDNLPAGFYRVTVRDDNGCSLVSDIYPVTEPGSPLTIVLNILKDIRPCNGEANGELAVNITGGTPIMSSGTAQYEIKLYRDGVLLSTTNGNSLSRNDLLEGSYVITATDANGITTSMQQFVKEPDVLELTYDLQQNVTCFNGTDGWIRVYVRGGKPNSAGRYQLSISGPEGTKTVTVPVGYYTFTDLSAGMHRIELIDDVNGDGLFVANGAAEGDCHQVLSDIEITQPEAHVVLSGDAVVCDGDQTTLQLLTTNWPNIAANPLRVTLSNGIVLTVNASPYFFVYTPSTSEFLEISSVTVVNCRKGTYSGSAMIDFKARPDARIVGNATICSGETTPLTFYFDGVAPWSVTYNNGSADIVVNNIQTSPYVVNVTPSATTTYTIKSVTDKYCAKVINQLLVSSNAKVVVNSLPTSVISGNATICEGQSTNLTFTLTGKAPWQVTYVADGVEQTIPDIMSSPYVVAVKPLQSASYVLKHVLDANGCEQDVSGSVLVTVNPLPDNPGAITGPLEVCQGELGVKYAIAAVTNDPGNTYSWTLPAGFTLTSGAGSTAITLNVSKTAVNGIIKVAVVNACGTSALSSEIYVTVNPLPDKPALITGPVRVCQGSTGIIYSIPATTNATSYVWSVPAGFNIISGQGTTTIQVDMDPSQSSVSGNITVTAVNDCGLGVVSDNLLVGIDPLPVVFAGTDENICSTSYIMKATNPGANFTGSWTVKSGAAVFDTPNANNSGVSNIAKGENVFVWTVRNNLTGCISTDEVTITNNQLVVTASANLYESCSGGATIYGTAIESGDTKTKGLWTFANNSTGVFSNAAASQTTVSNLSSGSVILRWTLTRNGCASSADVAILNNKPAQASIINKLAVADRCVDNVQLIAQPIEANSSGRWNVISGSGVFDKPLNTTVNVTGLMKDTVNRFSWTVSRGGCSVTDYVNVRNNQVVWSAGTDQTVCNDYTSLSGQIPKTELKNNVLWTVTKGNGSFANAMDARTRVDNLAFGENKFRWTISKNGCISADTVSVFSYKPSKATILTGNLSNCADTAVIEAVVPNPLNGLGYWGITSGSGQIDNLTATKTIVRGLKKGDNTLRWSVTSNGCTDYTEIKVTNKLVDVDAGRDFSSCSNIVKLNATAAPTGTTGEWSVVSNMGSGLFDPNNTTPTATVYGISSLRDANNDMLRGNVFVWTITKDGCQSTDTVVVTYNGKDTNPSQSFTAGNDVDINLSTYTMAASPLYKGEVGTWTIVSGGGNFKDVHSPTSVVSSLVQGANVFRWTVAYNGCSWSDEVTVVNGQVTPANAGLNQTVCEDVVILHANEPNGVGKGEWSIVQGSGDFINKSDPQTKVRYLGAGDNIFRWTISYNGSSASKDEVTITNNMPQTANAGVDDMTCSDWYQLEGNDPNGRGVATWSIINGGGSLGVQAPSMRVSSLSQGTNIFKYEINNHGCISIDSVKIINGLPTAPSAGVDRTICTDSIQLTPNNPTFGTGEWRIAEGFAQTPMTNNWAKQLAPGVNKFVWVITTEYQCTLTDTVSIISNKPTTSFAGYNQDICGDTAKLLGNGTEGKGIGTWYRITGAGTIDNPLNANTIVRNLGRGSNRFRWVIDNQGCTSSSDVEVVNNLIVADAGFSQTLCADTAIISGNTAFPGVGTWGVLSGSQGAKFDNPDEAYTVVRSLDRGENIITWTIDYKGCQSISKVSITNNMPTDANAGPNVKTCNDYVTLSAGAVSQGTGSWTIRNGGGTFDNLASPTAHVTNLSVGSNIFRWTTEYKGCSSSDDVEVAANTIKAVVGPDQPNLCSNTTTLQANSAAPGVGTWSVNGGGVSQATFEDVNNPNTVVSNLGKGKNTLRWTIINEGCPSFAELVVVNNSPSASYAGNSQEVCDAQVILDATVVPVGTGVGHWEVLTGSAKISDLNDAKATVTDLSQGDNVFRWSVVNGTCIDNDEVLIVNNKPSTPYAGNDEELCSSDYQLKAGVPEFGSGNWSIFKGSGTIAKPNSAETSISNVGYNENIFIWTITQGQCQLTDSVKLINNTPTKAQAGPDIQDCKSIIELDANIPGQNLGTGFWTLISGKGAFRDATNAKTEVYDLGFGENILQWTISKGNCFSSDQISVFNKIPDQALAGSDRTICENYVVLNANNPESGSGSWSVLSGQGEFEDKTRFDSKVKSVGFGKNQYKWTISYGECVTEDIVVVTSNKAYPYAGEDDVVYKPSYSLKASNPGSLTGQWTLLGGGGDFENDKFFNTTVANLNEGVNTYRWTIDVNGCMAYDDVSITYKLIPDAGFVVDTTKGCYPLTVQFTNYSLGGTVYNWDFGDGNTSADRNPKHIYTDEGEYTAVLTIPGPDGNDDVFSQRISVYGHPKAEFNVSPSTVYIPGESIRCLNLTNNARSYVWDFGDGTTSTEPSPMHEYLDEGVYDISLTVINEYGCEDVFYINSAVSAIKQGFIVFPNAFAPRPDVSNGIEQPNRVNEVFRPKYKDIDTYHLQIFDRWGQLIFESDDITQGWDGTYKNSPSAQDVYVFKAWGTFISGKEFRVTGNVLLVK